MRETLNTFIKDKGLTKTQADALHDAFDAHLELADVPKIDRTQVVKSAKILLTIPPPPLPEKDDEK